MAATYLLGYRDGTGKKSGKWYGMLNLLTKNGFGNWSIMDVFCVDRDVFDSAVDVGLYEPVVVSTNLSGQVTACVSDEKRDALNLDE